MGYSSRGAIGGTMDMGSSVRYQARDGNSGYNRNGSRNGVGDSMAIRVMLEGDTKAERRELRRKKKQRRMPKHGKGMAQTYRNAISKHILEEENVQ